MTLKGVFLVALFVGVVVGTAWARWRLSHGPLRGPARPGGRAGGDQAKRGSSG